MSRGTNWNLVNRREKGGPRRKVFREYSRDHTSPSQYPPTTTKADLRRMLEEAAANTAKLQTKGDAE